MGGFVDINGGKMSPLDIENQINGPMSDMNGIQAGMNTNNPALNNLVNGITGAPMLNDNMNMNMAAGKSDLSSSSEPGGDPFIDETKGVELNAYQKKVGNQLMNEMKAMTRPEEEPNSETTSMPADPVAKADMLPGMSGASDLDRMMVPGGNDAQNGPSKGLPTMVGNDAAGMQKISEKEIASQMSADQAMAETEPGETTNQIPESQMADEVGNSRPVFGAGMDAVSKFLDSKVVNKDAATQGSASAGTMGFDGSPNEQLNDPTNVNAYNIPGINNGNGEASTSAKSSNLNGQINNVNDPEFKKIPDIDNRDVEKIQQMDSQILKNVKV